ncbi:hypothetical protein ACQJBY_008859 [Aegilops geniculata]
MNESCWSPLNLSYGYSNVHLDAYVSSKRLSEEELLRHNESEGRAFEVVTLACGLVGGDTIQPILWSNIPVVVAPLTGNEMQCTTTPSSSCRRSAAPCRWCTSRTPARRTSSAWTSRPWLAASSAPSGTPTWRTTSPASPPATRSTRYCSRR